MSNSFNEAMSLSFVLSVTVLICISRIGHSDEIGFIHLIADQLLLNLPLPVIIS